MATINSRNINLTTPLDEYAAEIFINRKEGESLENFEERVRLGYENLYRSGYEAFEASLDYITTERTREIFEIEILENEEYDIADCEIESNEYGLFMVLGNQNFEYLYNEYKFIYSLDLALKDNNLISVNYGKDFEKSKYEKCSHIMPSSTSKKYLNFISSERIIVLPVKNAIRILDMLDMSSLISFYGEGNEKAYNPEEERLKMLIEYVEPKIKLKWNQFKVLECKSEKFKEMIKDENGFLTGEGAKLINEILKKQNTYWGK